MLLPAVPIVALLFADGLLSLFQDAAAALQRGDLARAESGFQQVLKQQPRNVGALGNLGVVYSRMGRTGDAISVYRRALKIVPGDVALERNLALAHLKHGNHAAAKPLLKKIGDKELLAVSMVHTGEAAAAIPILESLPPSPNILYTLGVAHLKTGDKDKARRLLDESLPASMSPAQAAFLRGKAYMDGTLFDEAVAQFDEARRLDPALPGVTLELAWALVSARQNERAGKELAQIAGTAEGAYLLGALWTTEGRVKDAIPLLERARVAQPGSWGAHYYLGRAHLQESRSAEAIALLKRAAELNPDEPAVFYQLARAYKSAGKDVLSREASARVAELKRQGVERDQRDVLR